MPSPLQDVNYNSVAHDADTGSARAYGFSSPELSAPAPAAYAPAGGGADTATQGPTPGQLAAMQAGAHSRNPLTSGLGGFALFGPLGGLFRKNATPIQDIAGALNAGRTITDAQWRAAGFGPNGAALAVPPAGGLSNVNTGTAVGGSPFLSGLAGYLLRRNAPMQSSGPTTSAAQPNPF